MTIAFCKIIMIVGDKMKKIVWLWIISFLLPMNTFAKNILDHYTVEIDIQKSHVQIIEKFDVVEIDNKDYNYSKMLASQNININNLESNIKNYQIFKEDSYNSTLIGKIERNHSYQIKYQIPNLYERKVEESLLFDSPEETIINNFTYKISYDKQTRIKVIKTSKDLYQNEEDGNILTGTLLEPTEDVSFEVSCYNRTNKSKELNSGIRTNTTRNFTLWFGNKTTQIIEIVLILFVIIGGYVLLKKSDKIKKIWALLYAIIITFLIALQFLWIEHSALLIVAIYLLVLWAFYLNISLIDVNGKIGDLYMLGVLLILSFISLTDVGETVGIIPHIINCVCAYASARIYKNYLEKKEN